MRELTRKERCALNAAANTIEQHPELTPALIQDYGISRAQVRDLREMLARRLVAIAGHVDEPGSQSALPPRQARSGRDWLAPYGSPDHTGFGEPGCVF